jgi:hypothetical protein
MERMLRYDLEIGVPRSAEMEEGVEKLFEKVKVTLVLQKRTPW